MPISATTYERVALEDSDHTWELVAGCLRRKPDMTQEHNGDMMELAFLLASQLDRRRYRVRVNSGRTRLPSGEYYVPDVMVVPVAALAPRGSHPGALETYSQPLPLVVEVWSPSTGDYDVETKFAAYRDRGDLEIWRVHPYERTLTAWRRQPDGSYVETLYRDGEVRPASLPGVVISLDELFV